MYNSDGYVDGDRDIKKMMDHWYTNSYTINSSLWGEGSIDKRFKVGDQNLLSMIYGEGTFYNRRKFFFNLIRRHINMCAGYQRQHRKSSIMLPSEGEDDQDASDYTALSLWSERREGFHEYFSQAFEGALDVGITLLQLYPDYSLDPVSGDFKCDTVAYNNFMIDPWFRKQDLSDCNFIWRRRWLTKQMAKTLLPGREKEIDKMRPDGMRDGRFPIQAEALSGMQMDLFTYDEFHYMDTRPATIVIDTMSGETVEWEDNPDDQKDEMEATLSQQPWLKVTKVQKSTVKLAAVLGGHVMYNGENLLSVDRYPYVPLLCYHEPDIQNYAWRITGMVRNLRDSQYLYNRRKVIELDILESQINSGYKYKVGSVTDEKCFRQSGQGFLIPVKATAEMTDVERIDAPGIPQSMVELSMSLAEDITKISGVNEELLGSADDDKAGILAMLRQGAGLTTLQTLFDKADYSQKLFAGLRIEAIRKNWSKGKIKNILGHEISPRFRLTNTQKYDVAIEQGVYSSTQKQMELKQLLHFREIGMPIPDETIIRAASIQNKDQLIQDMENAAKGQQEQEQAMMEQQQEQSQSQKMLDFAKAKRDMAGAQDLNASAAQKMAQMETIAADAEQSRTQADLNLVKQMIELEDMDLAQVRESLDLAELIKDRQEPEILQFAQ